MTKGAMVLSFTNMHEEDAYLYICSHGNVLKGA